MKQHQVITRAIALALLCGSAASVQAQDALLAKQLAGPPSEFAAMQPADPASAAINSSSALIPVELTQGRDGSWSWQGELAVEAADLRLLVLSNGSKDWQVSLRAPDGRSVSAATLRSSFEESRYGLGGNDYPAEVYGFSSLQSGRWGITVTAGKPSQTRGFLLVEGAGPDQLRSQQTSFAQLSGQRLGFLASLTAVDEMGAENTRLAGRIDSASLLVSAPDGSKQTYPMFDDGRHADGAAADGVYGGDFLAAGAGNFSVQVIARGQSLSGQPIVRTAEHLVPVVEADLSLSATKASGKAVSDQRLAIQLPVSSRAASEHNYRVIGQVWGSDGLSKSASVPVAWIGGISRAANGSMELGLDARWIALSGAKAPFELRNVRIEDADTFVTVVKADRLALDLGRLPDGANRAVTAISDEMRQGVRPAAQSTRGVGTKLLLVHGYCSGNVWGGVSGQFSNSAVFQDLNQNRSHDAFAQRIKTFGTPWNSYGIVAHSQGGAAALHLYTYYWSGLDYATGARLIQSVGTPYQGTNLAGNLAAIGSIFGAGCGTNTNLTYSGAASWLAGVPTSSRAKVNYYTTSFTDRAWLPDWCHVATDLLLSDPEDGTTERAYGQLSGAVNQGHKTGWCHTGGMRDPAQTTDSSRNSTMSANAAR